MAIAVECGECGKTLKAKDEAAGRLLRCPACENVIAVPSIRGIDLGIDLLSQKPTPAIPSKPQPFPPLDFGELDSGKQQSWPAFAAQPSDEIARPSSVTHDTSVARATKACPFCGETILAVARKCKHCGEFLDLSLKQANQAQPPQNWNPGIAALLSLIVPGLGQMYKGQVGVGIIQVIGWLAALGTGGYACLVLNVASFLHAALANPDKTANKGRSVVFTILLSFVVVVAFFSIVAIANKQKQEREARQERLRELNNSLDRAFEDVLGR